MVDQATYVATKSWTVPVGHPRIRLDAFARRCLPHLSRRAVEEAIRDGCFSVRQRVVKKGDQLAGGDELAFRGPEVWLAANPPPNAKLAAPIVYEDETILIVNKPAGMPTHGFSARDNATLANFLLWQVPQLTKVGKSRWEPGLVHRLDRETSGLVVIAKTQAALERLRLQFRRREVRKIYWALVCGKAPVEGVIDMPLAHAGRDQRRMRTVKGARRGQQRVWKALTRYRCIGRCRGASLLEIDMETGVTHQIRVHLAAIGHSIVGDSLYGDPKQDLGLRRHFLHARSLTFVHPQNDRILTLVAELPSELAELLVRLRITP